MFTICNGATEFNQWDLNQRVMEPRLVDGDKVIFLNSSGMTFPMMAYSHNGEVVVDVPNKLLTMSTPIVTYINGYCETRTSFNVVAQTKPDDYVFVDNDDWPSDVDMDTLEAAKAYTDEKCGSNSGGGAIEIFNLTEYGIDIVTPLLEGETEVLSNNEALIADVSNAFLGGKIPAFYPHQMLNTYAIAVSVHPEEEIVFSLCGDLGTGMLRVDIVVNKHRISAYMTPLG